MLTKTFDCHKKCDTIREIKLRRGSGLLEQCDAREAAGRAAFGRIDVCRGPVNVAVIQLSPNQLNGQPNQL